MQVEVKGGKVDHKQDSKKNIIKSHLLFAMVLMICCQPIMCLDLSYYAARLGITRTPTRKELLMLGAGVLFTVAVVYFLKQRWAAKKIDLGSPTGTASVSPPANSSSSGRADIQPFQPEESFSFGGRQYSAKEWAGFIQELSPIFQENALEQTFTNAQKKSIEAIIKELEALYAQGKRPIPYHFSTRSIEADKLLVAIILEKLDQLYEAEKVPNMPKFHEWFISLLNFYYSQSRDLKDKALIWCYLVNKEQATINFWNGFVRRRHDKKVLKKNFIDSVKNLLSLLTGGPTEYCSYGVRQEIWKLINGDFNTILQDLAKNNNMALLIHLLNVLYAVQRTQGIKDFYTTFVEKHNLGAITKDKDALIKLLTSKDQIIHQALRAELKRISTSDNVDFFKGGNNEQSSTALSDREQAQMILGHLIELTAPVAS